MTYGRSPVGTALEAIGKLMAKKGGETVAVKRPFEVRQFNQHLGEDIVVRLDHEDVDRISIEVEHPFYADADLHTAVLHIETAKQLYDVLGQMIEEQDDRALAIFMNQE